MPSTHHFQGKTEPRLFFITTFSLGGIFRASLFSGTVAHPPCSKKLVGCEWRLRVANIGCYLTFSVPPQIHWFLHCNRTLTLNWQKNWLGAWELPPPDLSFETYFLPACCFRLSWTFALWHAPFGLYSSLTFFLGRGTGKKRKSLIGLHSIMLLLLKDEVLARDN